MAGGKLDKRVAKNPAGFLIKSITTGENGYQTPPGFVSQAERDRQAESRRLAEKQASEERRRKQKAEAEERELAAAVTVYLNALTPEQLRQVEAEALAQASEETRLNLDKPEMKLFRKTSMMLMVKEYIERMIVADTLPVFQS